MLICSFDFQKKLLDFGESYVVIFNVFLPDLFAFFGCFKPAFC